MTSIGTLDRAAGSAAPMPPRSAPAAGDGHRGGGRGDAATLRLVGGPRSRATFWRRRLGVLAGLLLAGLVLVLAAGQVASADLEDRVDGHVVVEPGETLWEIAARSAPRGVDTRAQLAAIEDLNGLDAAEVEAWNVILLPAR